MTTNLIITCAFAAIVIISELYRMYKLEADSAFFWCDAYCEFSKAIELLGEKVFYQLDATEPPKVGVIRSYEHSYKLFTLTNGKTIPTSAIVARYDELYKDTLTND